MKLVTYCITFPEEYDILPNMIGQAKRLGDVLLVDGGPDGHLCHHPKAGVDPEVIRILAEEYGCLYERIDWPGNPGTQRNSALELLDGYDWIVQNDSDELWPDQSVEQLLELLPNVDGGVTNIQVKLLSLVGDESHYCRQFSNHLVHSRIHRPGAVSWSETWHEHQFFTGRRLMTDIWLIHTELLFEDRLLRIKGHGIREGWGDVDRTPLPPDRFGLTWPDLSYPEESWQQDSQPLA